MVSEDKSKIFESLKEKRKDISELRVTLNKVSDEKETCFKNREETGKKIKGLISQIKELKKKRDELTSVVKEKKKEKEKIVLEIKENITRITALRKDNMVNTRSSKNNPMGLKKQIEALETKLETEVMSFANEQKIMKKIKVIKSKFDEYKEVAKVFDEMNKISKYIDDLKVKEKQFKKEIRKNARQSQKEHEMMLELSKQVDELKKKEKESYDKFIEHKKEFTKITKELKDKLSQFGKIKGSADEFKDRKKQEREHKDKQALEDKKSLVDEKIRKGEKLTTEDLLVFQREA